MMPETIFRSLVSSARRFGWAFLAAALAASPAFASSPKRLSYSGDWISYTLALPDGGIGRAATYVSGDLFAVDFLYGHCSAPMFFIIEHEDHAAKSDDRVYVPFRARVDEDRLYLGAMELNQSRGDIYDNVHLVFKGHGSAGHFLGDLSAGRMLRLQLILPHDQGLYLKFPLHGSSSAIRRARRLCHTHAHGMRHYFPAPRLRRHAPRGKAPGNFPDNRQDSRFFPAPKTDAPKRTGPGDGVSSQAPSPGSSGSDSASPFRRI